MDYIGSTLANLLQQTAFFNLTFGNFIMIAGGIRVPVSGDQKRIRAALTGSDRVWYAVS